MSVVVTPNKEILFFDASLGLFEFNNVQGLRDFLVHLFQNYEVYEASSKGVAYVVYDALNHYKANEAKHSSMIHTYVDQRVDRLHRNFKRLRSEPYPLPVGTITNAIAITITITISQSSDEEPDEAEKNEKSREDEDISSSGSDQ